MNIINSIANFFIVDLKKQYDDGYDWAIQELKKGAAPKTLEAYLFFDGYNEFDKGAHDAIDEWNKKLENNEAKSNGQ